MASRKRAKQKVAEYFGDYDRRTLTKNERNILTTMESMALDLLNEVEHARKNGGIAHELQVSRKLADEEIKNLLRSLLNKVNKVTACFRHGNKIPEKYLAELSNRQIEVEEKFSKFSR